MDIEEARTILFGPKPTPDDAAIRDVLTRLWVSGQEDGYTTGKDEGCQDCYQDGSDDGYKRGMAEGRG
jgi:flagellar biosynthesis/type III secretory pathway protein FliH